MYLALRSNYESIPTSGGNRIADTLLTAVLIFELTTDYAARRCLRSRRAGDRERSTRRKARSDLRARDGSRDYRRVNLAEIIAGGSAYAADISSANFESTRYLNHLCAICNGAYAISST